MAGVTLGPLRAGRRRLPNTPIEGESAEARGRRIYNLVMQDSARRPDPKALPEGAETAQQTYAAFLRKDLAPRLRSLGLKGSGGDYYLDRGDLRGWLGFQKSTHNNKALVEFTINVHAMQLPSRQGFWGDRIGFVLPEQEDTWWVLPAGAATSELLSDLLSSIEDFALVAIDAAMELYGHAPEHTRRRQRTFAELAATRDLLARMHQPTPTIEEAFASIFNQEQPTQGNELFFLYRIAPNDPRLPAALLLVIEHDPSTFSRAAAAIMLGFVPCEPGKALPALRATVAGDDDFKVRAAANYRDPTCTTST